ncbi:MAG TPA: nuclear transport factor 2 family protein, partial [Longimicrobium sp.]
TSFRARDAEGMRACYHPDVVFSDPAFGELRGQAAGDMWAMLCSRAHDLRLDFGNVTADEENGKADWEARYTFSQTGRPVHNRIHAAFQFRDGLIVRHIDDFSFWRWSRQALGPAGLLLGWTPVLRAKVQSAALAGLDAYRQKAAAAADAAAPTPNP